MAKLPKRASPPPSAIALALTRAGLAPEEKGLVATVSKPPENPIKPTSEPEKAAPTSKPPKNRSATSKPPRNKAKSAKHAKSTKVSNKKTVIKGAKSKTPSADRPLFDSDARAEREQERRKEAARTISGIAQLPPDALLDLWLKQSPRAQDDQSNFQGLAKDYLEAIEGEWRRRAILARLDPEHFVWPSTNALPGNGAFGSIEHTEGILGYLGYHVGRTGEPSAARRQMMLSRIFEGPLPPINGPDYMEEWSQPDTPSRLRKMAEVIASAAKSAKCRSHADYSVAIDHWEEDLAYLYRTYYVDRFAFDWPGGGAVGQS